jgi:hypothetical protein
MGYAVPKQRGRGLLQRMRSQAFIICDVNKQENRVVMYQLITEWDLK